METGDMLVTELLRVILKVRLTCHMGGGSLKGSKPGNGIKENGS
jgi:hypothetical protein